MTKRIAYSRKYGYIERGYARRRSQGCIAARFLLRRKIGACSEEKEASDGAIIQKPVSSVRLNQGGRLHALRFQVFAVRAAQIANMKYSTFSSAMRMRS